VTSNPSVAAFIHEILIQATNENIEKVQIIAGWLNDFQESTQLFLGPLTL